MPLYLVYLIYVSFLFSCKNILYLLLTKKIWVTLPTSKYVFATRWRASLYKPITWQILVKPMQFSVLAAFKIGITFLMGILPWNIYELETVFCYCCLHVCPLDVSDCYHNHVCLLLTINLQSSERHFNKKSSLLQPTNSQSSCFVEI